LGTKGQILRKSLVPFFFFAEDFSIPFLDLSDVFIEKERNILDISHRLDGKSIFLLIYLIGAIECSI
jgi:hypothetical protein